MKDRVPTYPGRVKLTPVEGQANTYDMERADSPVEVGTPLNKATLLSDVVAAAYKLEEDEATPSNAFAKIAAGEIGGGGLAAEIIVNTETGAVVTATLGDKSVTRTAVNGQAIIKVSDYGEWTVTVAKDGATRTFTCTVTTAEQYTFSKHFAGKVNVQAFLQSAEWEIEESTSGTYNVLVMGGGGGGGNAWVNSNTGSYACGGGGGGGYVAKGVFTRAQLPDTTIQITIGSGGASKASGGASSFGNLLSANGGAPGNTPGASTNTSGGAGGSGGGCGGAYSGYGGGASIGTGGAGSDYGGAGGGSKSSGNAGINTTNYEGEYSTGTGAGGVSAATSTSYAGGGGGGGYGGVGGNNPGNSAGGGGGGGYGSIGTGGNGGISGNSYTAATAGGTGGGGGGGGYYNSMAGGVKSGGSGGSGIVVVSWQGYID